MGNPIKRHHEPRQGVISRPRKPETGFYFIKPEDRRSSEWLAGGTAVHDDRWHGDDGALALRKMGFTRG